MKLKQCIYFPLFIALFTACIYGAGSYPLAEYYQLDMNRSDIAAKINKFREDNPQYKLFTKQDSETVEYADSATDQSEDTEDFQHFYFYFADKDLTLHCIINKNSGNYPTIFGFDAVSAGTNFGGWKDINGKKLSKKEKEDLKKKFENEILSKLGRWKHYK